MQSRQKTTLILITFILIFTIAIHPVSADGMAYVKPYADISSWELLNENSQTCVINYNNKYENMILSIAVDDLAGEEAVWLFPVPSKPEDVAIDVFKSFPQFHGYDIKEEAKETLSESFEIMRYSQVYTLSALFIGMYDYRMSLEATAGMGFETDVIIHEHIEKMGLTTELITSKNSYAFHDYLTGKGLDMPPESKSVLEEYIGKEYSFIVSWISDVEEFKKHAAIEYKHDYLRRHIDSEQSYLLAVSIKFPTDKIYFPLIPTSIYGSETIPITVYVLGHVTPEIYHNIKSSTEVSYLVDSHYSVPDELSIFFNNRKKITNLKYTKIKINEPSKYLIDDLWMKNSAPASILVAGIIHNRWIWAPPLFILISSIASILAGMVVFRGSNPPKKDFAVLGLFNFLTVVGLAAVSYLNHIDKKLSAPTEEIIVKDMKTSIKVTMILSAVLVAASVALYIYLNNLSTLDIAPAPLLEYLFMIALTPLWIIEMILYFFGIEFLFHILETNEILLILLGYVSYCMIFLPIIRAYHKNKKLMQFILLFSIIFMVLAFISETLMGLLL